MKLIGQFFRSGPQSVALSAQDFAVLAAFRAVGASAVCAADIYSFMKERLDRDPRLPTIYAVIVRMKELGMLQEAGESIAPRGGRPRRLYRLTTAGHHALDIADQMSTAQARAAGEFRVA